MSFLKFLKFDVKSFIGISHSVLFRLKVYLLFEINCKDKLDLFDIDFDKSVRVKHINVLDGHA